MILVYSYYCLDIIHEGHLLQLKNAKAIAGPDGRSIVGILTDEAVMEKKSCPAIPFVERVRIAQSIDCVDVVVPQVTYSPLDNVKAIGASVLMESASHSTEDIRKAHACMAELGGQVITTPYYPCQSSTDIKERCR